MASLKILQYMLQTVSLKPVEAKDLAKALLIPQATVYHALGTLQKHQLVERVQGGWMLSDSILQSGAKVTAACTQLSVKNIKEKIYG